MNIDFKLTEKAFADLGIEGFAAMSSQHQSNPLFELLETGKLSAAELCIAFRKATGSELTDEQIKTAFNALLLDFPPERLEWLDRIRQKYNVYLFSNTNSIHYEALMEIFAKTAKQPDLNKYFIKAWYSHELGLRKPYVESFQKILEEGGLNPAETLFIDDTAQNIEGAQKAGLQTILLTPPLTVVDLEF